MNAAGTYIYPSDCMRVGFSGSSSTAQLRWPAREQARASGAAGSSLTAGSPWRCCCPCWLLSGSFPSKRMRLLMKHKPEIAWKAWKYWLDAGLSFFYPEVCQYCGQEQATVGEGFIGANCRQNVKFIQPPFCER